MQNSKSVFHIISNTHWDREWRFPFQRNRQMLVDMIDAVLDVLDSVPEYRAFHLDSQAIVLKDYLEIKPQNRDRIVRLTHEKRLLHGPWYILPEQFQVGGENLIRNLLLGHKVSNCLGGVSKVGYSPFSWGQISQLPQLYKQFSIDLIMFYRGINSIDSPKAEFLWEGADGTQMVSSRFSTMPRYNFYFYIYRPVIHNEGFYDLEYIWGHKGTPFHFADTKLSNEDYYIITPHSDFYPEHIEPQVHKIISDQADDFTTPHIIWMEGHDSSGINPQTVRILNEIRDRLPHLNVVHSTLVDYANAIRSTVNSEKLKLVKGERRSSQNNNRCGNLFGYTTSARMYLKQANFDAERWIQYYAEPFNVFSAWMGRDINDQYPEIAWELIIQNSAHDSIGGCSLDPIHEDMITRYKHSIEISKGVFERSLKYLLTTMNTSVFQDSDNSIFITSVNPTNYERGGVVEAIIDIPTNLDKGFFRLCDEEGNEKSVQLLSRNAYRPVLEQMINRPLYIDMVRYRAMVEISEIPSFGCRTMLLQPTNETDIPFISNTDNVLENEFILATINENGSINFTDKQLSVEYTNQAYLYDEGEAGHAWVHSPVGVTLNTLGAKPTIKRTIKGPLYNEFAVMHTLMIPTDLSSRKSENNEYTRNEVTIKFGLAKGSRHLKIDVEVENKAESHRLRIMFPSGLQATHSFGEGQFDVPARSIERPNTIDWVEQPMYDYPLHHFVDLTDGVKGLAVLVDGLKEYEVLEDEKKTIAITLMRTFEYKINPSAPQDYSFEKGSQMLGKNKFRMALYSHRGDWREGRVYREAFLFNYLPSLVQTGKLNGDGSSFSSFLKIDNDDLIYSCLKKAEETKDAFVLRIYNPTRSEIVSKITVGVLLNKVEEVNLEEKEPVDLKLIDSRSFEVFVQAGKIKTFKLFV